jgi:hypothetical protein
MDMRLLLLLVIATASARADQPKAEPPAAKSFEAALDGAEPVGDLTARLDPLFADCKRENDLELRQCTAVRDLMLERLKAGTWVGLGDDAALTWTPWTPGEKQLGLEVHGCLACKKPLALGDASSQHFVTTAVPKAIKGGRAVGLDVGFYGVSLPDQATAARFVKQTIPRLVSQFVFRVGPLWKSGEKFEGVTFVPVAQRVFDRCTGKVYASDPPSQKPAEPQPDARCPAKTAAPAPVDETLPDQLSRADVVKAMRAVEQPIHQCYFKHKQDGTVQVRVVIDGQNGIEGLAVQGTFDGTPTGECVKKAVSKAPFGRFAGEKMTIVYPFMLR